MSGGIFTSIKNKFIKNSDNYMFTKIVWIRRELLLTGIKRGREQVRVFLKKVGLKPRKVGMIPAKADVEAQEKFLHEALEPRIAEAQSGNRSLFCRCRALCISPIFRYFMDIFQSVC